jgi:hypothetical protein
VTAALGLLLGVAALAAGCAGGAREGRTPADDYLRYVGFDLPFDENVLLHGSRRQMPLRVHLPQPPEGFYADPVALHDVVRDGVTDWTDVADPGMPSGRGKEPAFDVIYGTMFHELGHALGLAGHSPDPNDVMGRGARLDRSPTERGRATLRALYAKPNGHRVTGPKRVD